MTSCDCFAISKRANLNLIISPWEPIHSLVDVYNNFQCSENLAYRIIEIHPKSMDWLAKNYFYN